MKLSKERILPLSLTAFVILIDQLSKAFIVKNWPEMGLIKDVFNNNFLWIFHVRNKAIAFSLGDNLPDILRPLVFIAIPILVLIFLLWYYLKSDEFTRLQRWAAASIMGGGFGNIIDRVFRPDGVVDFISVRFYGIFGMDRWPTFNFADSAVVVGCITLLITMIIFPQKAKEAEVTENTVTARINTNDSESQDINTEENSTNE